MTLPNAPYGSPAGTPFQLPAGQAPAPQTGALFYAALLKVGTIECDCEVCKIIKRLAKSIVTQVEAEIDAPNG
jgi:hypothetical protein